MDMGERLMELMGNINFRFDDDLNSPNQLLEMGVHNLAEYNRIKAMPEERQQRIENLFGVIMAEIIQAEALQKHGDSSDASVRQFLENEFSKPEIRLELEKYNQLAKEAIANEGLKDYQQDAVYQLLDLMPRLTIEFIVEGVGRFRLLPRTEAPQIISVLVDMLEEAERADTSRHN